MIADRVLRWIGGGQESLGDMGAEREAKAQFAAVIATGSQATSAGVQASAGDSEKTKPKDKDAEGKSQTDPEQTETNGSSDTSTTSQSAADTSLPSNSDPGNTK